MVCLLLWASCLLIVLLFTVFRYVWFYCLCFVDILLLLTADVCVYVGCLVWWVFGCFAVLVLGLGVCITGGFLVYDWFGLLVT